MSSNYDRVWAKVVERHQDDSRSHSNAPKLAYLGSDLIKRLAVEMNFSPQSPVAYAGFLRDRSSKLSDDYHARWENAEKLIARHAELTKLIAEQQAILDTIDPLRTPVHMVADAQQKIGALGEILGTIPEDALNFHKLNEGAHKLIADFRAREVEKLKAWRVRLGAERQRIVNDINALGTQSIDLESYSIRPAAAGLLLDELYYITQAIDDAGENLKTANGGVAIPEFSEYLTSAAG